MVRLSAASILLLITALGSISYLRARSVRSELAQLQEQTGLSLVTIENRSIQAVVFSRREVVKVRDLQGGIGAMSLDGTEAAFVSDTAPFDLVISRMDGRDFREYRNVGIPTNNCLCWSYDKSKLVIGSMNTGSLGAPLQLLDVRSGLVHEIAKTGRITSQCWSPDDQHLIYVSNERLQVYDLEKQHSQDLQVKGTQATWSPDGKRVAFLDYDTYYSMDPFRTNEKQPLFRKRGAESGLWWSPDSHFVAYTSQAGLFEGGLLVPDSEVYWLRVRRLRDNSESRISGAGGGESYEWVTNNNLLSTSLRPPR